MFENASALRLVASQFISKIRRIPTLGKVCLIVTLHVALLPFINLRFATFRAHRLGHFIAETELAFTQWASRGNTKRKRLLIWVMPTTACNEALREKYCKVLNGMSDSRVLDTRSSALARWLLPALVEMAAKVESQQWRGRAYGGSPIDMGVDRLGHVGDRPHLLQFSDEEIDAGWAELAKIGLSRSTPFVCLHVRDNAYLSTEYPSHDWTYHDYRNPDPSTYLPAIERLGQLGFHVVRMGKHSIKWDLPTPTNFIDYSHSAVRSDFLDLFLYANCIFAIAGTTSGIDQLASTFNKPIVVTNMVPFVEPIFAVPNILVIPVLLQEEGSCRLIALSEMTKNQWGSAQAYRTRGILLKRNSQEEICAVVEEMVQRIRGRRKYTHEEAELQTQFWRCAHKVGISASTPPKFLSDNRTLPRIGMDFLQEHASLLTS